MGGADGTAPQSLQNLKSTLLAIKTCYNSKLWMPNGTSTGRSPIFRRMEIRERPVR